MENKKLFNKSAEIILDSMNDGVFTIDRTFCIISFNKAAEKITGISKENAIGCYCWEIFKAEKCKKDCILNKSIRTGKPISNEYFNIIREDGKEIPISVSCSVIKDSDGKIIGGVESFRDLTLIKSLKNEIKNSDYFHDIISKNEKLKEIFNILPDIAESESNVLIEGESGTGKELIAKAIHKLSLRKDKRFVAINCGALPDTLLESELFGYEKGAFTDAKLSKQGKFEYAKNGTLFFDEIGDVSAAFQVKLLRILQEKKYEPLGSNKTIDSDVRVIFATNKKLREEVKKGNFRSDLFYRINVIKIKVPPLRERKEDIPLLTQHFINKIKAKSKKDIHGISPEVLNAFLEYDWAGNVRELENIIEYAFILCPKGLILIEHLPENFRMSALKNENINGNNLVKNKLEMIIKKAIYTSLIKNKWNLTKTSKDLGIHKTTLWRKIKKFKIIKPNIP